MAISLHDWNGGFIQQDDVRWAEKDVGADGYQQESKYH